MYRLVRIGYKINMKRLIYLFSILLIGNFSCAPICACSPAMAELYLVIRSNAGDLLNPKTNGYFPQDQIKLTLKKKNDVLSNPVNVTINPPINYGDIKLSYYQLRVSNAYALVYHDYELYLTLPNRLPVLLKLNIRNDARKLELLTIDGVDIKPEDKFPLNTLFYYTL